MQQDTATPANRRREPRRRAKNWTKATCHKGTMQIGTNIAVNVLDVAETGMRLVVRDSLENNTDVNVTLETPNHRRPLAVPGRVMWCVETADRAYCIGVEFHKRLSYSELTKFT